MSGLVKAIVTGQSLIDDTETEIAAAGVAAGANPTKAEYDALVGKFNALLVSLKANGLVKG